MKGPSRLTDRAWRKDFERGVHRRGEGRAERRIVDQRIDAAIARLDRGEHRDDTFLAGDVAFKTRMAGAESSRQFNHPGAGEINRHHGVAIGVERSHQLSANAAGGAGYDHDTARLMHGMLLPEQRVC